MTGGTFDDQGNVMISRNHPGADWYRWVQVCVPLPWGLLMGQVKINKTEDGWNVSCNNCTISNCVIGINNNTQLLTVRQPAFVMIPVTISGPWYDDTGVQMWEELENAMSREKRIVGLAIAGIAALIGLIGSAVASGVALSRESHTAHQVNQLAKNVSLALGTQESLDEKIESRLNALYDTVQFLGDKVQGLQIKTSLQCHARFRWICVTKKVWNSTQHPWPKVRAHLQGIWHNNNATLDLLMLHQEILAIRDAPPLEDDLGKTVEAVLNKFLGLVTRPT